MMQINLHFTEFHYLRFCKRNWLWSKIISNDGRDSVQRYEIIYLIPSPPPPPPLCSFSKELQATVRLLAPKCDITFLVSEDGSGKGAAMVTAVAQRLALQSRLLEDSDGEDEDEEEEEEEK